MPSLADKQKAEEEARLKAEKEVEEVEEVKAVKKVNKKKHDTNK
jgi:hypothetical protein